VLKYNLGFDLRLLPQGQQPTDYRAMSSVGPGVFELRDQDERAWYRVIYLSKVRDPIHVLHSFEKRSCGDAPEGNQYGAAAVENGVDANDSGEEAWRAVNQLT
jgi:phage-related protein